MSRNFVSFTKIEQFYYVRKTLSVYPELLGDNPVVSYKAKVKLHGTNAGVRIDRDGTVTAFKRTGVVTPFADNMGFAAWVAKLTWPNLTAECGDYVVYGEWCGSGVQKGVAISNIDGKIFAPFAVLFLEKPMGEDFEESPPVIGNFLPDGVNPISWFNDGELFVIDHSNDDFEGTLSRINAAVDDVEKCDPWVKENFGIEGTGEGLVFYPVSHRGYKHFSDLGFKAKGTQHQIVGKTKPVQADPTIADSAAEFALMVVTDARLERGVRAVCSGELVFDMKKTGDFIKWIVNDISKECNVELVASGLDAKVAMRACTGRAQRWFVDNAKKVRA